MSSPFPWPPKPSPRDGPHGGAPGAQPHAPDSLPPQTVVGSSCTPLGKKGATTEATEVIEQPSKPIEPVELSEADTRKVQEAFVTIVPKIRQTYLNDLKIFEHHYHEWRIATSFGLVIVRNHPSFRGSCTMRFWP